jgi:TetR/AcrR family transcriptional repressor of nem operon
VPRPRQFDPEQALLKAMEVFWTKGYEAVSVDELVRATGVNRFSLYEQFGDKNGLFARCLEHYDGIFFQMFLDDLADPSEGAAAIHRCLDNFERRLRTPEAARGCFMLNTAGDLGARNPEIARRIRLRLRQLERALTATIEGAQQRGEISKARDARDCARFLNALIQGTTTLRKATGDRAALRATIAAAHATLDSWRQRP